MGKRHAYRHGCSRSFRGHELGTMGYDLLFADFKCANEPSITILVYQPCPGNGQGTPKPVPVVTSIALNPWNDFINSKAAMVNLVY